MVARITYGVIGDEMVDVVTTLPPSNRQATAEISNEHANQRIRDEVVCDSTMSGIVGCEHNLVLSSFSGSLVEDASGLPKRDRGRQPMSSTTHNVT